MRYEAKHSYFKKLAQSVGNFINLPWTVAMRHQMLQCYEYSSDNSIIDRNPEVGPGKDKDTCNYHLHVYVCIIV